MKTRSANLEALLLREPKHRRFLVQEMPLDQRWVQPLGQHARNETSSTADVDDRCRFEPKDRFFQEGNDELISDRVRQASDLPKIRRPIHVAHIPSWSSGIVLGLRSS